MAAAVGGLGIAMVALGTGCFSDTGDAATSEEDAGDATTSDGSSDTSGNSDPTGGTDSADETGSTGLDDACTPGELLYKVPLVGAFATGVELTGNDEPLLLGHFSGRVQLPSATLTKTDDDVIVAAFDAEGSELWHRQFGGNGSDFGMGLSVSGTGEIAITTLYDGTGNLGGPDFPTATAFNTGFAVLGPDGSHIRSTAISTTAAQGGAGVDLDAQGKAALVLAVEGVADIDGTMFGNAGSVRQVAFVNIDEAGAVSTALTFGGSTPATGVTAAWSGSSVIVAGHFEGDLDVAGTLVSAANGSGVFAAQIDEFAGSAAWAQALDGSGDDELTAASVAPNGEILLAGTFTGDLQIGTHSLSADGASDIFVAKLDPTGSPKWGISIGGVGMDAPRSIDGSADGMIVVSGEFSNAVNFGGQQVVALGEVDAFVATVTPTGSVRGVYTVGGAGRDRAQSVAVDGQGDVYVTVNFQGSVDFGDGANVDGPGDANTSLVKLCGQT